MNFEKIELIGFKSFADKCEITFDNGVTAIVGPNGCGKSNISDAIRWVLGEQSAKMMRGSSMTDVIFNGTQTRKSLSYCEVSLFFDNSNKIFKSCEYNEVILTRKLFRNGDSEYYINKQPARMKDIVDLLHECGVSKSGYTIIGQGKVSEILSSKPEDRRAIFEEAVGIAKSKATRLESERKLARTKENIIRLSDILDVLEKQLEPAQRSSEKTKKFLELSAQLKYHEINNYLYKRENATTVKNKINLRIQAINEQLELNEKELKKAGEDYNLHMRERSESDNIINNLHDQILIKSLDQEKLQGQTKVYHEKISSIKSEIERLDKDKQEKQEKSQLLKKAIAAKKDDLIKFTDEKKQLNEQLEQKSAKLSELLTQIAEGEDLNRHNQSEILRTAENLADISKNIGSLDTEKSVFSSRQREIIERASVLTENINTLNKEKVNIELEISTTEKLQQQLREAIEKTEKQISQINNRISELANEIYKNNLQLSDLKSNQRFYYNMKETFEGYPASVRKLMLDSKKNSELSKRIKGLVGSVISTDAKYQAALEAAIGNAVQNIITATPEDAQYLLEYLKRIEGGRVTFLPISSVKIRSDSPEILYAQKESGSIGLATQIVKYDSYFDRVIKYLLGNTLVADNSQNALNIAKKYKFAFKIVTLDGDIFNASGAITGGSKRASSANAMSAERMLESLTENIKKTESILQNKNAEKDTITAQSNSLVEKLDNLNEQLRLSKEKISVLSERLNSVSSLLKDRESDLDANKEEINSVADKLLDISKRYSDIEEGNKKLVEQKDLAASENVKIKEKYDKLKSERDSLIDQISQIRAKVSFLESEVNNASNDITRMETEAREAEFTINKDSEEIQSDTAIIEGFYKEIERLTLSCEENSDIKELRDELSRQEEKKQKLTGTIAQDDLKREICTSEISKLTEKKHEEEISIAKVDSELEYMEQRVNEEYNLTYEDCIGQRDNEYDISNSNQEIARLKHRISSLGTINPGAIEEYSKLSEDYNAQKAQIDDLFKAEADLKDGIKRLTSEMLSTFNEGFATIKEHFKRIFKELFGGGSADLLLIDSETEDPLDAGIEIVAEPPGKKLQKISLLSGGEMSLTAIAILFAILKLRPMPFCVLDEIEAALDDANVERFARYLQNFSKETQFVVITHKKVTMELSDALFGVTMQEKGVSKIVSVKLSDIKDTLEEQ